jgi:NAD(P)-dependent dehydrogenase (short-subunit alcohol dehydrogenase family)
MCGEAGMESTFLPTDVASEAAIAALVSLAVDRFSQVDILFNNAGIGGAFGQIEAIPVEQWDRTQNILLRSVFLGIKHVVPHMKRQGGGAIINTSSLAGSRGYRGIHAYCAAKAGVINLTRSAAIELGEHRIRVNCVCPGSVLTPMHGVRMSMAEAERALARDQPIARAGQPADVAAAVLYFASDAAEWVTGVSMDIDGGAMAGVWPYPEETGPAQATGFMGPSFRPDDPVLPGA